MQKNKQKNYEFMYLILITQILEVLLSSFK